MKQFDFLPIAGTPKAPDPAVVVFSGGQDSTTCLGVALALHETVKAVSFYYGQRHKVELLQAAKICDAHGVEHALVDISFFGNLVTSALVGERGNVADSHPHKPGLPASFVPNRNAMFLTIAHAIAQEERATAVYTGVCETDYSGYPDCRADFIISLEAALNLGYQARVKFVTPLMHLDKGDTFDLANQVGFLDVVLEDSHTCYNGDRTARHEWGYGCGQCPACDLREKGWLTFQERRIGNDNR